MAAPNRADRDELRNSIMPYSLIVGQQGLKLALEIASVVPSVGGVLISGQRGTAKTTTVRAFAMMLTGHLPTTVPIGVTEDRVLSGWKVKSLLKGVPEPQPGLLQEASESPARMLYIDEVNLLDDYIVNITLDALSTKILVVDRDHLRLEPRLVRFTLVGTMNPDEGWLRPQLLDRFALMTEVEATPSADDRRKILETVVEFDRESGNPRGTFIATARRRDHHRRHQLEAARSLAPGLRFAPDVLATCARLAAQYDAAGHRGELAIIRAARAVAAIEIATASESALLGQSAPLNETAPLNEITTAHVRKVAKLALIHRRGKGTPGSVPEWTPDDDKALSKLIPAADG
jgi:magnesium chelatase subunit I